jgi:hypothetical protein
MLTTSEMPNHQNSLELPKMFRRFAEVRASEPRQAFVGKSRKKEISASGDSAAALLFRELSVSTRFEAFLADLQTRDFRIQRLARNAQFRRRTRRSCHSSVAFQERSFDHFSLPIGHR